MKSRVDRWLSAVPWRLVFWAAVVVGVVASLWPMPEDSEPLFPNADKVAHAVAFAVLVGLGWLGRLRSMIRLSTGLVLLGAAIEVAQSFTPTRTAEWGDLLADAVGIAVGLCVVTWIGRRSARLPQEDRRQAVVE